MPTGHRAVRSSEKMTYVTAMFIPLSRVQIQGVLILINIYIYIFYICQMIDSHMVTILWSNFGDLHGNLKLVVTWSLSSSVF